MTGSTRATPRRLLSHSALLVALRLGGAGMALAVQAGIARAWGAETLGHYMLAMAAASIAAVSLPLGFSIIGSYFAAEYAARGQGAALRAFARRAYGHVACLALAAAGVAAIVAHRFPVPLDRLWVPALLLAAGTSAIFVAGGLLVGLRRPVAGIAADALGRPAVLLVSLGAAVLLPPDGVSPLALLLWIAAAGVAVLASVQAVVSYRSLTRVPLDRPWNDVERTRWFRFAPAWVLVTLATDLVFELDLLLLAPLLDPADTAVFGLCIRLFSIVAFATATVGAIALPDIAAVGPDARHEVAERSRDATRLATALALVAAVLALLFAGPVAAIVFGPAFRPAGEPLAVLCVGLAARSAVGPAALLLSLHDAPYAALPPLAVGLVALVVGNLVLVPMFGLVGAAWAAACALAVGAYGLRAAGIARTGLDVSIVAPVTSLRNRS